MNSDLLSRLLEAECNFKGTAFQPIVDRAQEFFAENQVKEAVIELCQLPSDAELLKSLIDRLKGKSVYKTLKRMNEGKIKNNAEALKGLFSLGAHIVIECEQGHGEYRALLPVIHERIGELVYEVTA